MSINIDANKLRLSNGKSISKAFKDEVHRFKTILQKHINAYYRSYTPNVYTRNYDLAYGFEVDDYIQITAKGLEAHIKFTDKAYHESLYGGGTINAIQLMNDGWQVKKDVWFKDIYRFGYYEGAHFIESAIDEFQKANYLGIKIKIEY